MMTVLNTVEIMNPHPAGFWLFGISLLCVVISFILCMIDESWSTVISAIAIFGSICALAAILSLIILPEQPTGKFQIEATFTDDFPFTSVMKEYDVIEQRGDIFLLEPKVEID